MSSKRRRHTSESSDIINEDDSDDGGSVKSGFSAFLYGLSKKRGTRNVNSRLVCCNVVKYAEHFIDVCYQKKL